MNVLFLISGGDSGGAKTHVFALLDALRGKANVKLVCFMEGVFYREILDRDVETILLPQKSRFDLSVVSDLEKIIKNNRITLNNVYSEKIRPQKDSITWFDYGNYVIEYKNRR